MSALEHPGLAIVTKSIAFLSSEQQAFIAHTLFEQHSKILDAFIWPLTLEDSFDYNLAALLLLLEAPLPEDTTSTEPLNPIHLVLAEAGLTHEQKVLVLSNLREQVFISFISHAHSEFTQLSEQHPDVHPLDLADMLDDHIIGSKVREYGPPFSSTQRVFSPRQIMDLEEINIGDQIMKCHVSGERMLVIVTSEPYFDDESERWQVDCTYPNPPKGRIYETAQNLGLSGLVVPTEADMWNQWNWLEQPFPLAQKGIQVVSLTDDLGDNGQRHIDHPHTIDLLKGRKPNRKNEKTFILFELPPGVEISYSSIAYQVKRRVTGKPYCYTDLSSQKAFLSVEVPNNQANKAELTLYAEPVGGKGKGTYFIFRCNLVERR